ncbi:uncharacterized protein LOC129314451 isoform X1 [Prosopis cineraria]|uniref:uncharacterized protein LOC129314451 isoform X1 n=1 Tax=Prosopis cineraria TaxID=364024 RepID=UPI00240FEC32|nr:uncharacterized protein LOC129314451 isoform X1 [Prosopis cineraria]
MVKQTWQRLRKQQQKLLERPKMSNSLSDSKAMDQPDEFVGSEVLNNEKNMEGPQQPTNGTKNISKGTQDQIAYSTILEDPNVEKIKTTNQLNKDESSKDEMVLKDLKKKAIAMDPRSLRETRHDIPYNDPKNIVKERVERDASLDTLHHPSSSASTKKVPIPMSPNLDGVITSKTIEIFEEQEQEEEEGGLIATRRKRNGMKATGSSSSGKEHETPLYGNPSLPSGQIFSSERASKIILPLGLVPSKSPTSPKRTPSKSTYGRNIQDNVGTAKKPLHQVVDTIQDSSVAPSIDGTNKPLSVPGVQEIIDMMKLEGVEPSVLEEAFKTHPQLHLSSEDRSTELLRYSYRVLLNILNILATKTPFTITEADKRLLAKHLKDASVLGLEKDWLESIRIKVFNCDVSEVHLMQETLKGLGNKLQANKMELANVRDQEAKASQSVEMAQRVGGST